MLIVIRPVYCILNNSIRKPLFRKGAVLIMPIKTYRDSIPMLVETPVVTVLPDTVTESSGRSGVTVMS